MKLDREEFLSALSDAAPALAVRDTIPALQNFWFSEGCVYAYDGGLGVRVPFNTGLECGLPGKALMDLLRTSALKEVELTEDDGEITVRLGKAVVKMRSVSMDGFPWNFPEPEAKKPPKKAVAFELSADVLAAFGRMETSRRTGKAERTIEQGVVVIPGKVTAFYATDSASISHIDVGVTSPKDMPKLLVPWEFVDRFLKLAAPDNPMYILDDCLVVQNGEVLVCSNLLEFPDAPDVEKVAAPHLTDEQDTLAELPPGLQGALDRAIILGGKEEAVVKLAATAKTLSVRGKFPLGELNETFALKTSVDDAQGSFAADRIRRGLKGTNAFLLDGALIMQEPKEGFSYILAGKHDPETKTTKTKKKEEPEEDPDEEERKPSGRRRPQRSDMDDEIPF